MLGDLMVKNAQLGRECNVPQKIIIIYVSPMYKKIKGLLIKYQIALNFTHSQNRVL